MVAGSQPELLELLLVDEEDQQANPRDGLSLSPLLVERGDTGNADALLELVSLHDGLLVTQNLAELAGAAPGDTLEVSTPLAGSDCFRAGTPVHCCKWMYYSVVSGLPVLLCGYRRRAWESVTHCLMAKRHNPG